MDSYLEITQLRDRITELEREKAEVEGFAAVAAHELLTPVVMIDACAATVSDRSNTCVKFVSRNVGEIAGHYYAQQVFGGNSRKEVESIIANLKNTYTKSFPKYAWLDKTTLQGALTKMAVMGVKVGWSVSNPDVSA